MMGVPGYESEASNGYTDDQSTVAWSFVGFLGLSENKDIVG